jgi:hypothetical protein
MMRIFATALAAGALLSASQTLAADEPAAPPPPPSAMPHAASHTDPNQVICKREANSESRLGGTKVCHTRQEWADMSAAARTSVDSMQRSANYTSPH